MPDIVTYIIKSILSHFTNHYFEYKKLREKILHTLNQHPDCFLNISAAINPSTKKIYSITNAHNDLRSVAIELEIFIREIKNNSSFIAMLHIPSIEQLENICNKLYTLSNTVYWNYHDFGTFPVNERNYQALTYIETYLYKHKTISKKQVS